MKISPVKIGAVCVVLLVCVALFREETFTEEVADELDHEHTDAVTAQSRKYAESKKASKKNAAGRKGPPKASISASSTDILPDWLSDALEGSAPEGAPAKPSPSKAATKRPPVASAAPKPQPKPKAAPKVDSSPAKRPDAAGVGATGLPDWLTPKYRRGGENAAPARTADTSEEEDEPSQEVPQEESPEETEGSEEEVEPPVQALWPGMMTATSGGSESGAGAGGGIENGFMPLEELKARGRKVRGPNTKVANCKSCKPVRVPEMCEYLQPLAEPGQGRRLLADLEDPAPAPARVNETAVARRLLQAPRAAGAAPRRPTAPRPAAPRPAAAAKPPAAKRKPRPRQRTTFQAADRKITAKSRQPDFKIPSEGVQQHIRDTLNKWFNARDDGSICGFWTRKCIRRWMADEEATGIRAGIKKGKGPETFFGANRPHGAPFPEGGEMAFPDLQPGELGSCAIVAVGNNMLGKKRGPEIDHHDTVFRYNGPIKAYKADVGQKGDVFYWKQRRDEKQYGVEGQKANKFYMWKNPSKFHMFGDKKDIPQLVFRGKQMLWETGLAGEMDQAYTQYNAEARGGDAQKHAASGGFHLAMAVVASGLCTRLDLYGFSAEGGGRYFKDAVVNTVHVIGLENWIYRQAMEEGHGLCIYDS